MDLRAAVLREHVFCKKSKKKRKRVLSRGSQFFFEDFRDFFVVFPGFVCRGYSRIHVSLKTIMLGKHFKKNASLSIERVFKKCRKHVF